MLIQFGIGQTKIEVEPILYIKGSKMKRMFTCLFTAFGLLVSASPLIAFTAQSSQPQNAYALAWSPGGAYLAVGGRGLWIYDQDFNEVHYSEASNNVTIVEWSPTGDRLLANLNSDTDVFVLDVITLDVITSFQDTFGFIGWSSDGERLAFLSNGLTSITIFGAETGEIITEIPLNNGNNNVLSAAWSPDGSQFAITISGGRVYIVSLEGDIRQLHSLIAGRVVWSPDGRWIAGTSVNDTLRVWDAGTGHEIYILQSDLGAMTYLAWSPVGDLIIGANIRGQIVVWDVDTRSQVQAYLSAGAISEIVYSPYGGRIAVGNNFDQLIYVDPDRYSALPQVESQLNLQTTLTPNVVQIIVPDPSPERLQAIAEACDAPPQVVQAITGIAADAQAPNTLSALVETVEALPAADIPPGCAADLVAVANAIQAQSE